MASLPGALQSAQTSLLRTRFDIFWQNSLEKDKDVKHSQTMMTSRLCSATVSTLLTCPPLQLNKAASHSALQKPHLSPSLPSFLALNARLVDLLPIKMGTAVWIYHLIPFSKSMTHCKCVLLPHILECVGTYEETEGFESLCSVTASGGKMKTCL